MVYLLCVSCNEIYALLFVTLLHCYMWLNSNVIVIAHAHVNVSDVQPELLYPFVAPL